MVDGERPACSAVSCRRSVYAKPNMNTPKSTIRIHSTCTPRGNSRILSLQIEPSSDFGKVCKTSSDAGTRLHVVSAAARIRVELNRIGRKRVRLRVFAWQTGFGTPTGAQKSDGDYDNDGDVDGDDFLGWQVDFGSSGEGAAVGHGVPEPRSMAVVLVMVAVGMFSMTNQRWSSGRVASTSRDQSES